MTNFVPIRPTLAGIAYTPVVATAGPDTFDAQRGGVYTVLIENASASPTTVTFDDKNSALPAGGTPGTGAWADVPVTVAAGAKKAVDLPVNRFIDSTTGKVSFTANPFATINITVLGPN